MADKELEVVSTHFSPECVRVEFGNGSFKNISWADFLQNFDEAFKDQRERAQNGPARSSSRLLLPSNVLAIEETDKKELLVNLYYPEKKVDLRFDNYRSTGDGDDRYVTYEDCPLPNILIYAKLKLNPTTKLYALSTCRYFCTFLKREEIDLSDGLVREVNTRNRIWPLVLPNMYENGNMCYGGNSVANTLEKEDIRNLQWQYDLIFQSPFNRDLSVPSQTTGNGAQSWLAHLSDHDVFPYWDLTSSPYDSEEDYRRNRMPHTISQGEEA